MSDYLGNYGSTASTGVMAGLGIYIGIMAVIYLVMIIAWWIIFKKAGRHGWESLIPIYNIYVLFEIGGQKGIYILFNLIPCVGSIIFFIFEIKAVIGLSKRFGKSTGFGILTILFPMIGFPILAFSSAKYELPRVESTASILDVDTKGVSNGENFNYGYDQNNTVADVPAQSVQNVEPVVEQPVVQEQTIVEPITNTEPVSTPVENVTTEQPVTEQVQEEVTPEVETQNAEVPTQEENPFDINNFHTPSALDKKDE